MGLRCVGCGLCEGACPRGAVTVFECGSIGLKPIVNRDLCGECGLCLELCPLPEIVIPDDLEKIRALFQGHSHVPELYLNGASGGVVSSILYHLFDKNMIDAALVAFYDDKLNIYGDFITSKEDVIKHAGSYYQTCKQMLNIKKISEYKAVAAVGLPCHIEALKKYAKRFKVNNIKMTVSLFCTIGRMRVGFENFLKEKFNVDLNNIKASSYLSRCGEDKCGKIIIKTKKKQAEFLYLDYLDYIDYFYTPIGCFNCRKMFGLNADISVGDDWSIKTNKKIALVLANTDRGELLLEELGILKLRMINQGEALLHLLKSQPNGVPIKIHSPMETKVMLILAKSVGSALKGLHFPRKISNLTRRLAVMHIKSRAKKTKAYNRMS